MLRVGIVGAGDISAFHAEAYQQLPGIEIAAWADPVATRARARAERFGGRVLASLEQLLHRGDVDIVDICSPDALHSAQAAAALTAGCHVLCEKPLGLDLDEASRVVALGRRTSRIFMVGQLLRFSPAYEWMRTFLRDESLGAPLAVYAARLNPYPSWREWFHDPALSGGAAADLMIHDADYCHWLFGRASRVVAIGRRGSDGVWNHVQSLVSFRSGVTGTFEASYLMPGGFPPTFALRVLCERGCVEYAMRTKQAVTVYETGKEPLVPEIPSGSPFFREIAYFVDCVERNESPRVIRPEEALHSLAIVLAAVQSLQREGEPIAVQATDE